MDIAIHWLLGLGILIRNAIKLREAVHMRPFFEQNMAESKETDTYGWENNGNVSSNMLGFSCPNTS